MLYGTTHQYGAHDEFWVDYDLRHWSLADFQVFEVDTSGYPQPKRVSFNESVEAYLGFKSLPLNVARRRHYARES